MNKEEEIEFDHVLEALDLARRKLKDMANFPDNKPFYMAGSWAKHVLAGIEEMEAAE